MFCFVTDGMGRDADLSMQAQIFDHFNTREISSTSTVSTLRGILRLRPV